jgi:hypothetical protein
MQDNHLKLKQPTDTKYQLAVRFDIQKKITYRGWIMESLKANGWRGVDLDHFKICMLKDIKGMARTWLKDGQRSYIQTYHNAVRINFCKNVR